MYEKDSEISRVRSIANSIYNGIKESSWDNENIILLLSKSMRSIENILEVWQKYLAKKLNKNQSMREDVGEKLKFLEMNRGKTMLNSFPLIFLQDRLFMLIGQFEIEIVVYLKFWWLSSFKSGQKNYTSA